MRFVAGRGAVAELLAVSAMAKRMAAPWRRAIGKLLLAGAPWQSVCREAALWRSICWPGVPWRKTIGKLLLARAPWQSCWP